MRAGTFAASDEVDLQHVEADRGERARRTRGHRTRFVHLVAESRQMEHRPDYRYRRSSKDAKAPAAFNWQIERILQNLQ
jgi:hypothetical protein